MASADDTGRGVLDTCQLKVGVNPLTGVRQLRKGHPPFLYGSLRPIVAQLKLLPMGSSGPAVCGGGRAMNSLGRQRTLDLIPRVIAILDKASSSC